MQKILIIAYEFPPINTGGSQRPYKFARNLEAFGFEPIIITPSVDESKNVDEQLRKELKDSGLKVIRTGIEKPGSANSIFDSYYFNIMDKAGEMWAKELIQTTNQLIHENDISIIFATVPPFSIGELALKIGSQFNIPVVLDWRDAWSQWNVSPYASKLHYLLTLKKENQLLKKANVNITTSRQTADDFQRLHNDIHKSRFAVIHNSYQGQRLESKEKVNAGKKRIGYVGSFYFDPYSQSLIDSPRWKKKPHQFFQYIPRKENWLYRTPYFLFKALSQMKKQDPQLAQKIEFSFAGKKEKWFDKMVHEFEIEDLVNHLGWLSHDESIQFQTACDALFITSSKVDGGKDYSIAGKTFEYFKISKPIIAFVCEGAQKEILEKSGQALISNPDQLEQCIINLQQYMSGKWKMNQNKDFIDSFQAKETTKELVQVFEKLI